MRAWMFPGTLRKVIPINLQTAGSATVVPSFSHRITPVEDKFHGCNWNPWLLPPLLPAQILRSLPRLVLMARGLSTGLRPTLRPPHLE